MTASTQNNITGKRYEDHLRDAGFTVEPPVKNQGRGAAMMRIEALEIFTDLTFFKGASIPAFYWGHWWLAYYKTMPVAFAGVIPSTRARNSGYLLPRWCA